MKILFIHNNYASNNSGEEHAAESLKEILESNGHQVKWFRRFSDVINNSTAKKIQAFFSGVYNPSAVKELKILLDDFEPDIVQVQNLYPFISPGIVKSIKSRGIPLVMRCPNYRLFCPTGLHLDGQGNICEKCLSGVRELNCISKNCENDVPKSIGYALRNFIARAFWGVTKNMDAYIVQSVFQRQKFIDNGIPAHKLFILPGLLPKTTLIQRPITPKNVSFIGRVSEEKGIREFLKAASLLPEIPFVVAGSINSNVAQLKTNAPKNVLWKGFVAGKALDELYAESKIVVAPSKWYEGFPNVITTAMKFAKPVITSNLGAMADIIDHQENGILVEPGDAVALAKAIKNLFYYDEKCVFLGKNAKIKADTLYTEKKIYQNLIDLYLILLDEKARKTKSILSILHYPPPVHGAAMVGQYIMGNKRINTTFNIQYINLGTSVRVDEIGRAGWLKVKRYFMILRLSFNRLISAKPKLVYFTLTASGAGFYKDALIVLLVKLFGCKVVFHFHNKGVSKRQHRWLDHFIYKVVFKKTRVILLSEHLYSDIEKYVPKERVYICPNGIPENINERIDKQESKGRVQLLFLSNLIVSKGVYVLLKACQLLVQKNVIFHCTFIGNTGDIDVERFQEEVSSLGLQDYVSYDGPKYGLEKEKAYAKNEIFVFPTFYSNECFPLVLLEAMQSGLPLISTFEGGIRDIVKDGETGFLVEKENEVALADKIEILIKNPELRKKMGEAGRKYYEANFTLEAFESRFHEILEDLVQ